MKQIPGAIILPAPTTQCATQVTVSSRKIKHRNIRTADEIDSPRLSWDVLGILTRGSHNPTASKAQRQQLRLYNGSRVIFGKLPCGWRGDGGLLISVSVPVCASLNIWDNLRPREV